MAAYVGRLDLSWTARERSAVTRGGTELQWRTRDEPDTARKGRGARLPAGPPREPSRVRRGFHGHREDHLLDGDGRGLLAPRCAGVHAGCEGRCRRAVPARDDD